MNTDLTLNSFSQVVYIPEQLFRSKSLKLNQLVKVTTDKSCYICNAYVGMAEDGSLVKIYASVYKPFRSRLFSDPNSKQSLVSIQEITKNKALKIEINLLVTDEFYNCFSWYKIEKFYYRHLLGKVVSDNYVCDTRNISYNMGIEGLLIEKVECVQEFAVIAEDTEIVIKNIHLVSLHYQNNLLKNPRILNNELYQQITTLIKSKTSILQSFLIWGPEESGKSVIIKDIARKSNSQFISLNIPLFFHSFNTFQQRFNASLNSARQISESFPCFLVLTGIGILQNSREGVVCLKHIQESVLNLSNNSNIVLFATSTEAIDSIFNFTHEFFIGFLKRENKKELLIDILKTVNTNQKISNNQLKDNNHLKEIEKLYETIKNLEIVIDKNDDNISTIDTTASSLSDNNKIEEGTNESANDDVEDVCDLLGGMTVGEVIHMFKKALLFKQKPEKEVSARDLMAVMGSMSSKAGMGARKKINMVAYEEQRMQILQALSWPSKHKEAYQRLNLKGDRGLLLHGPPGCGKTCLVQQACILARFSLVYLASSDIYSPYLGDSEKNLKKTFLQAKASSPCVLFIDEIDSMVACRGSMGDGDGGSISGSVQQRVLTELLTFMDGIDSNNQEEDSRVVVVACTNRFNSLDVALLRRFDRIIHVPTPDITARRAILEHYINNIYQPDNDESDTSLLDMLVEKTENFSGADLENFCKQAYMKSIEKNEKLLRRHFEEVLSFMKPSSW